MNGSPYERQKPLGLVDVTVGTQIIVVSTRTYKEVGRFTIMEPARKVSGVWEIRAAVTSAYGSEPFDIIACYLGLVQADCEHSRLDPHAAYFDPNP